MINSLRTLKEKVTKKQHSRTDDNVNRQMDSPESVKKKHKIKLFNKTEHHLVGS